MFLFEKPHKYYTLLIIKKYEQLTRNNMINEKWKKNMNSNEQ